MIELTVTPVAGCAYLGHAAYLEKWVPKVLKHIPKAPKEISISLLGDTKMAKLHQEFMNIPGTTDVLTFEVDHDANGRIIAGEIVICVPYAKREAKKRKIDINHELLLYSLHGILHLTGFDDLSPADYKKMHAMEDKILTKIGIGAIFHSTKK